MDSFTYNSLQTTYNGFENPIAIIEVDGKDIRDAKGFVVSDIEVDLTCGFEAGQASFSYYDCYDLISTTFEYKKIKKYILLGSPVVVSLGYELTAREVFRGVIVRVEFVVDDIAPPHVRVTAMDIKAIMMANNNQKQLQSLIYSQAIKEIFNQSVYMELTNPTGVITKLDISETPDSLSAVLDGDTDDSIEMAGESDYEFVVRAAKKFNYEFFCSSGTVVFREAKCDTSTLLTFSNDTKIFTMHVGYDITGLVNKVEVRGANPGKSGAVRFSMNYREKISAGSYAKRLIDGSEYVFVDPTAKSRLDAQRRCNFMYEDMQYRFGSLDMEIMGLPEVIPGRFIELTDFDTAVSNIFYVREVKHTLDDTGRFITRIIGSANKLQTNLSDLLT